MKLDQLHLCFVGNMLGRNPKFVTTQGQIVADLFAEERYTVTCVSSKINRAARLFEIIRTLINGRKKFDVVLLEVYSGMNFIVAILASCLCGAFDLPLIMVLHGGNLPEFIRKYPKWTKFALSRADSIVAPSTYLSKQLRNWNFDVEVIPNVIDISQYQFRERKNVLPKLLWMRSFHPIYNPEMAIKVLQRLCQRGQDATLTMAGNDKGMEESLKLMTVEMGLSNRIRFAGFLDPDQKFTEFEVADIYLNTNRIDNMPVSVIEARAFGLPVVATDVGGLPHLIEHMENGMIGPTEDFESMVKNVEMLLDNPSLAQKISRRGRKLAEQSAWSKVRLHWEKLILEVVENKDVKIRKDRFFENGLSSKNLESKL
jgi:L-malate glycosyltransferase